MEHILSPQVLSDYERLRSSCGVLTGQSVAAIALKGEDRVDWLQGQVTNDLRGLERGMTKGFCLCRNTGQIQAVGRVWALPDALILAADSEGVAALHQRIAQMVVIEDVESDSLDSTHQLFCIQGPSSTDELSKHLELPSSDAGSVSFEGERILCLRADRTGYGGWDLWVPLGSSAAFEARTSAIPSIGEEGYEIARIVAGIPRRGKNYGDRTLPAELGPNFLASHVSFRKGCYVGQEVIMRMHSRGHANRQWVGLRSSEAFSGGSAILHSDALEVGTTQDAVFSPQFGYIGTAMVRTEFAEPSKSVLIRSDGRNVEAEVCELPFRSLA
jgi:tRNA-modifying protein YgfZ